MGTIMFDPSAPHIIILLVVVLLLFGSTRLPGAAKAIGKSMHIFKRSVKGLDDDDDKQPESGQTVTTVMTPNQRQLTSQQPDSAQQAQIDALQRQLNDLQRQNVPNDAQQGSDSAAAGRPDSRSY
jgi:sec-independent protein translocase protein TatA